jgi:hypothetical protein
MIFSIAFKNSSTIIYSIPYKAIYNEYVSCLDSTPVYSQLALFPYMYITGSREGVLCVYEPASKYLISYGNVMNGYPVMGSILANFV